MFKVLSFFALLRPRQWVLPPILQQVYSPIEVLAFDLDILHAIASLVLPHLAVGFLFPCTHDAKLRLQGREEPSSL